MGNRTLTELLDQFNTADGDDDAKFPLFSEELHALRVLTGRAARDFWSEDRIAELADILRLVNARGNASTEEAGE